MIEDQESPDNSDEDSGEIKYFINTPNDEPISPQDAERILELMARTYRKELVVQSEGISLDQIRLALQATKLGVENGDGVTIAHYHMNDFSKEGRIVDADRDVDTVEDNTDAWIELMEEYGEKVPMPYLVVDNLDPRQERMLHTMLARILGYHYFPEDPAVVADVQPMPLEELAAIVDELALYSQESEYIVQKVGLADEDEIDIGLFVFPGVSQEVTGKSVAVLEEFHRRQGRLGKYNSVEVESTTDRINEDGVFLGTQVKMVVDWPTREKMEALAWQSAKALKRAVSVSARKPNRKRISTEEWDLLENE